MVENLSHPPARELVLAEALAHVPGYDPGDPSLTITELSHRSVNRSYGVSTSLGRFALRLSRAPDAWLTTNRSVERVLHGLAARAGIAPPILHATDRWFITEYVSGRQWVQSDFANPEALACLGETLRRLHELPVPGEGHFDLLRILEGYVARIGGVAGALTGCLETAAAAWGLSGAAERPSAILHHDLHAENVIDTGHRLMLIDWECAAVSDPLLDVACVLSYHESTRPFASLLLQHSGFQGITPRQLAASVWLFDLHTYLWYRERRLRLSPTDAELEAERLLAARLSVSPLSDPRPFG